jgi:hypothetical protein
MDLSPCVIAGIVLFGIPICIGAGFGCFSIMKNCVRHKSHDFYLNSGFAGMVMSAMLLVGVTAYNTRSVKPCGQDSLTKAVKGTPLQMVASALPCDCGK